MTDPHLGRQRDYYDHHVDDYEKDGFLRRGLTYAYQRKAAIISRELKAATPANVLEVGAGSGLMTFYLCDMLPADVVAMDMSEAMLEVARQRITNPKVSYFVGDARKLDLGDAAFDAVVGVDVIHHLDDPSAAMREWRRVVRRGGKMVFLESNAYNPLNLRNIGVEHEVRSFLNTDTNLAKWAREGGWTDVTVRAAPSFTPAGPRLLRPLFNVIDRAGPTLPVFRRLTALWLLVARKG